MFVLSREFFESDKVEKSQLSPEKGPKFELIKVGSTTFDFLNRIGKIEFSNGTYF